LHRRQNLLHFALAWLRRPCPNKRITFSGAAKICAKAAVLCVQSQQGVLASLLVRELEESKYEVVAGARRLRAARLAELDSLPVRVVKLTDAEAIEAQVAELSVVGQGFLC